MTPSLESSFPDEMALGRILCRKKTCLDVFQDSATVKEALGAEAYPCPNWMLVGLELQSEIHQLLPHLHNAFSAEHMESLHPRNQQDVVYVVNICSNHTGVSFTRYRQAFKSKHPAVLLIPKSLRQILSVRGSFWRSCQAAVGGGRTDVGLPRRTTLTPFSCKPCRILSVAAFVSAQASTAPTLCSPPVSTFTILLKICSKASSVLVFPVPGGPCK